MYFRRLACVHIVCTTTDSRVRADLVRAAVAAARAQAVRVDSSLTTVMMISTARRDDDK